MRGLPPHPLRVRRIDIEFGIRHSDFEMKQLLAIVLSLSLFGCAKLPAGGGIPTTKRVTFSSTMQSAINQNFVYIIPLRPSALSNPPDQGPVPVVAPPWGN